MSTMNTTPTNTPTPIAWHVDPGHAWLEVPRASIAGVAISSFSFVRGDVAYLEEDCDAGAWVRHHGIPREEWMALPVIEHDAFPRNMERVAA